MKRAVHLRPSRTEAGPSDVGYRIGRSSNAAVRANIEDSILVIGSALGKGEHIVINAILDARAGRDYVDAAGKPHDDAARSATTGPCGGL